MPAAVANNFITPLQYKTDLIVSRTELLLLMTSSTPHLFIYQRNCLFSLASLDVIMILFPYQKSGIALKIPTVSEL